MDPHSIDNLNTQMNALQLDTDNSTDPILPNSIEVSSEQSTIQLFLNKLEPYIGIYEDLEGCGAGSFVVTDKEKLIDNSYKIILFARSKTKKTFTPRHNRSDRIESIYQVFRCFLYVTSKGYSYPTSRGIKKTNDLNTAVRQLLCKKDIVNQYTDLVISPATLLDQSCAKEAVANIIDRLPYQQGKILKISRRYLRDYFNLLSPHSLVAIDANKIYYLVHGEKGLKGIGGFKKVKELRALEGDDVALSIPRVKYIKGEYERTELIEGPSKELKEFLTELEKDNPHFLKYFCISKYYDGITISGKGFIYKSFLISDLYHDNLKKLDFKNLDFDSFLNILNSIQLPIKWLHEYGLVHFDIKPQNYLFKRDEDTYQVALTDFDFLLKITENLPEYISLRGTEGYRPSTAKSQKTKVCKSYAFKEDIYAYLKTAYVLVSSYLRESSMIPDELDIDGLANFFDKCFSKEKHYNRIMRQSGAFVKCNGSIHEAICGILPKHLAEKWSSPEEMQRLKKIYPVSIHKLQLDYLNYKYRVKLVEKIEKTDEPIMSYEEFADEHEFYESREFYLLALSTLLTEDYLDLLPSLDKISDEINKLRY